MTYEKLASLLEKVDDKLNGNRMRDIMKLVARTYDDNPEALKRYFNSENDNVAGIATAAYHYLVGDITPIQNCAWGGLGAIINQSRSGLKFDQFQLRYAKVGNYALYKSENSDSALEYSENSGSALWQSKNSVDALYGSKNSDHALNESENCDTTLRETINTDCSLEDSKNSDSALSGSENYDNSLKRSRNLGEALRYSKNTGKALERSYNEGKSLQYSENSSEALSESTNTDKALQHSINHNDALKCSNNSGESLQYSQNSDCLDQSNNSGESLQYSYNTHALDKSNNSEKSLQYSKNVGFSLLDSTNSGDAMQYSKNELKSPSSCKVLDEAFYGAKDTEGRNLNFELSEVLSLCTDQTKDVISNIEKLIGGDDVINHRIKLNGNELHFSPIFYFDDRPMVIYFSRRHGRFEPRLAYKSKSLGFWRVTPFVDSDDGSSHFEKSIGTDYSYTQCTRFDPSISRELDSKLKVYTYTNSEVFNNINALLQPEEGQDVNINNNTYELIAKHVDTDANTLVVCGYHGEEKYKKVYNNKIVNYQYIINDSIEYNIKHEPEYGTFSINSNGFEIKSIVDHFTIKNMSKYQYDVLMKYIKGDIKCIEDFRGEEELIHCNELYENVHGFPLYDLNNEAIDSIMENLTYPDGFVPDFNENPLKRYTLNHFYLGDVNLEIFRGHYSLREEPVPINWHIAYDNDGRVWIDNIVFENCEPNLFGTYSKVLNCGILAYKPLDHKTQTDKLTEGLHKREYDSGNDDVTPLFERLKPIKDFRKAKAKKGEMLKANN